MASTFSESGPPSKRLKAAVSSEFDYFQSELVQAAIIREFDKDYLPIATLQDETPIEFYIKGADRLYLDLNNSKLEIKGKFVLAADGKDVPADAHVGPVNNFLHSLFSKVEVDVQGTTVGDVNDLYPYRAYLETLLSATGQLEATRLKTEAYLRDTNEQESDWKTGDADGNLGKNKGYKDRQKAFATSKQVTMVGRLHHDLFHQNLDLPPNIDLKIRLLPARKEFYIKKPVDNAVLYRFVITKARLLMRTKEASASLVLAHEKMLQKANFRIPLNKVSLTRRTIASGTSSLEIDNLFQGTLPKRIMCALVRDSHMHGEFSTNPFFMQNFGLTHMGIDVNGIECPKIPYQPDFTNGDYIREYFLFLEGLGLDLGTKTINITPEDWARNCNIYVFRLMPSGIPSIPASGSVRLKLKFAVAAAFNINLLVYSESSNVLEIDQAHNVIIT